MLKRIGYAAILVIALGACNDTFVLGPIGSFPSQPDNDLPAPASNEPVGSGTYYEVLEDGSVVDPDGNVVRPPGTPTPAGAGSSVED